MYCDAHFHIVQCFHDKKPAVDTGGVPYAACSCAHDTAEYAEQHLLITQLEQDSGGLCRIYPAFGMHPQMPLVENAGFMEMLLRTGAVAAVGEAGFDLFSEEYRRTAAIQEEAWHIQLELAVQFGRPLVIHCRKALDRLFRDDKLLRKLPAVVLHSFAFGPVEACALLSHGINAFFSFGKQICNGNKKSIACVQTLDADRLLMETDAPFQVLKGETVTRPEEIIKVYRTAEALRGLSGDSIAAYENRIESNFRSIYAY